ncbi:MAG: ATP-binding cassette domain-containing protein [Proteobacteria bacterium]|nr:ATP-binding cassette domain-containing protein [Pseudomonadota bacterium]
MLTVSNLTYRIAGRVILEDAGVTIHDGWRVGVVGPNGAGKSTLFKLLAGELQADLGIVEVSTRQRIGMVRQDIPDGDTSLIDIVLAADTERADLMERAETETDPFALADIHTRLNDIGAYAAPARAAAILAGLGFTESQLQEPISAFSGGWRMRVALAAALFQEPEILLLDEPTNHLDIEAIMWLEDYLAKYPHTLLIISHDRALLNTCVDHIVHVDKQQLALYTGTYDTFERERAERLMQQQKMFEKQQAQRAHMQAFIDRFRYKASKARQAQSRIKALERMDVVDAVIADRARKFDFPQPDKLSPPIMALDMVDVGYTAGQPVLRRVNERIDMDDRIALLGANGNGKSTLIKLVADKLQPMGGEVRRSGKLRIGYFSQHQTDELDVTATPYETLARRMKGAKEPAVRAKLGQFGFSKELADNKIGSLSGGEKARLLFALMSLDAPHLLLLDEPTNHLDIDAREALVQALNMYEGAVMIVSHDPSMIERVADRLWLVKDGVCQPFEGDLSDYRRMVMEDRRSAARESKAEKADKAARAPSRKELRQQEAQKRKAHADLVKKIEEAEKVMSRLTDKKKALESQMADPAFYEDAAKMQDAQFAYGKLIKDLGDAEEVWMHAQEAYDEAS